MSLKILAINKVDDNSARIGLLSSYANDLSTTVRRVIKKFQVIVMISKHTSRISKVGMCGRKSLPTKKHINIKSSMSRSKSTSKGESYIFRSNSRYSRNSHMCRSCQATHAQKMKDATKVIYSAK